MIATIIMLVALSLPNSGQVKDLDSYGLAPLTVMSDVEGESIRGRGFYSYSGWNVSGSTRTGFYLSAGGGSSISGYGSVSGFSITSWGEVN